MYLFTHSHKVLEILQWPMIAFCVMYIGMLIHSNYVCWKRNKEYAE